MTKSVLNYCPKYWNTLQAFVWINGMFLTWEPFMYLLFFLYFLSFRKSRLHIGCLSSTESWTWLMLHATLFTIFLFFTLIVTAVIALIVLGHILNSESTLLETHPCFGSLFDVQSTIWVLKQNQLRNTVLKIKVHQKVLQALVLQALSPLHQ